METTTQTRSGREVLDAILEAAERQDPEMLRPLMHPDIIAEWPQSGERFVGPDNAVGAMTATETKPELAGEPRVVGGGDVWVMMLPARYGDETWQYVGVFELEDGRLRHVTEYFGAPFEAPESRARFVDRSPAGS